MCAHGIVKQVSLRTSAMEQASVSQDGFPVHAWYLVAAPPRQHQNPLVMVQLGSRFHGQERPLSLLARYSRPRRTVLALNRILQQANKSERGDICTVFV